MILCIDIISRNSLRQSAVFEIVQGWALKADGETREYEEHFVQPFTLKNGGMMTFADHLKLKQA